MGQFTAAVVPNLRPVDKFLLYWWYFHIQPFVLHYLNYTYYRTLEFSVRQFNGIRKLIEFFRCTKVVCGAYNNI